MAVAAAWQARNHHATLAAKKQRISSENRQ